MAPSPPYRRGSNRPRVDSQQEMGNPGRRNPQRQGAGRHCGRSTGVALFLKLTCYAKKKGHAGPIPTTTNNNRNTDRPKPTPGETNQNQDKKREKHRAGKRATTNKKKKQARGEALGKLMSTEYGLETKSAARMQRNTRGNPNPNGVWVSPAPERERKKEREKETRRRRKYQTKKRTKRTGN